MKTTLLTVLLVYSTLAFAQESEQVMVPFLQKGKYGFADENKQVVIKPKFDLVLPFYSAYELTTVIKKGKPLVINKKEKIVFKGSSDYFYEDTMSTMQIIQHQKIERIAIRSFCQTSSCPEFAIIEAFEKKKVFDKMNQLYFVSNSGKVVLINSKGETKTKEYDKIRHYNYKELEYCITEDHVNQKFGLLDENGKTILECVYDAVNYKSDGIFALKQGSIERDLKVKTRSYSTTENTIQKEINYKIERKNKQSGVVDKDGKEVIPFNYDELYPLNENKFIFWKEKLVGIIAINEHLLFKHELHFDYSQKRQHNNFVPYLVMNKNKVFFNVDKKWVLVNLNGDKQGSFDGIHIDFQTVANEIAGVVVNNKLGMIDKTGKTLLEPNFDQIYCLRSNKSFVVKKENNWSWLNSEGKSIYEGFDNFTYLLKDYLLVLKNNEWFYVNNKGKEFKSE